LNDYVVRNGAFWVGTKCAIHLFIRICFQEPVILIPLRSAVPAILSEQHQIFFKKIFTEFKKSLKIPVLLKKRGSKGEIK